jgi:hypothetical protein
MRVSSSLESGAGVAVGHVLGVNVLAAALPDEREVGGGFFEAGGVDRVHHRVFLGEGGIADEPAAIEAIFVGLAGAGEVPVAVPDFDPHVIARLVGPLRNADHPRRHADRSARVDEEDR